MEPDEIKKAIDILRDRIDRAETIGVGGKLALTAYWIDGGQRLFYTLDQVREHIAEH